MGRPQELELEQILFTMKIEKSVKDKYTKFCDSNGYSVAKRIRLLIKKDLENNI